MFTERELLILSFAVDKYRMEAKDGLTFFSHADADMLCNKIHHMLKKRRTVKLYQRDDGFVCEV